jgi:hypothetical protein
VNIEGRSLQTVASAGSRRLEQPEAQRAGAGGEWSVVVDHAIARVFGRAFELVPARRSLAHRDRVGATSIARLGHTIDGGGPRAAEQEQAHTTDNAVKRWYGGGCP